MYKNSNFLLFALIIIIAGCSLEKQSGLNRSMQNLTAHYNILFNANELLRRKQESYAASFPDAYTELLNVYPDTTSQSGSPDRDMELAITKANTIINIKEQSHYIGDAYLVLGKARFLEGSYFDAVEYFSYVIRSFGNNFPLAQEAMVWKGRSLLYLNNLPQAKLTIDSAVQNINPKKPGKSFTADVYATRMQYNINTQNYAEAEGDAKQAIQFCSVSRLKLRWIFILAQLQELNLKPADAYDSYTRIVQSNASFEMAFNANLNRIRIQDNRNGIKLSKIDQLRKLLKNHDNIDFFDQVYYHIGQQYYSTGDIDNAIKNYKLSIRHSTKNQNQRGVSYLRIADIDFKNKANYEGAKLYYDSTLTYLSPSYPGYQLIVKKSNNLQLLTGLLQTIAREDTLQMLAALDEKTRAAHIDAMVARKAAQDKAAAAEAAAAAASNNNGDPFSNSFTLNNPDAQQNGQNRQNGQNGQNVVSSFYFYNNNAVSQGYTAFKRQWGNRKLEDNWRRSKRSNTGLPVSAAPSGPNTTTDKLAGVTGKAADSLRSVIYKQDLIHDLPLTAALLSQSNIRIYNAYLDLGNLYRDVLEDKKEAIAAFEKMLARFPDNPDKPAIYYNLYRLYTDIDASKSDMYKNRILKEYPQTAFAKIILDPEYSRKLNDANAGFNVFYNQVYDLYEQKQYTQVISSADDLLKRYPDNRFAAQLFYLKAIAAGHQEKLPPFMADMQEIIEKYPDDVLITPLAQQHLAYINANMAEVANRPVVLNNEDPNEIPFTPPVAYQKQTEYRKTYIPSPQAPEYRHPVSAPLNGLASATTKINTQLNAPQGKLSANHIQQPAYVLQQANQANPDSVTTTVAPPVIVAQNIASIFSKRDSTHFYFAINVTSGTTNLASSRFGIGQFNRIRFFGYGFKHELVNAGPDNQIIYIGRFFSLSDARKYAKSIIPVLPDIMKVPKDKYSFFIITKENLDKLADQKTVDSYMDYYQKNY
ncbi:Tetratricopeptide repeat-containing protein [Mucilaginibacter lappiensis]|uniref:Tetratricopeptide (TPR) repeat protein n=1 Tax=Mucilaginibacter lappiensis TaxID=354630 RepID=A0ABR6PPI1_9SPHI|nr:tetratricopeptide repeat protein [Mucilaginibacter lappiensis]MBB6111654.1 tetratricopeptide (TPR) repeat protein [Mucilaginibacter lappiensis]SIR83839.1 Tetratricopeptide repeat-containing protein [Mucilaginibacter lappiensis]